MRALGLAALLLILLLPPSFAAAQAALPVFDTSRTYRQEAEFTQAIQPYQAALSADARNAQAHYWLGFAYLYAYRLYRGGLAPFAAGYLPRALASLRQSVSLDARFVPAILALHDALVLSGLHEEADALVKRLLQQSRPAGASYTLPP